MNTARRQLAGVLAVMTMAGAQAQAQPSAKAEPPPVARTAERAHATATLERAQQAVKANEFATARRLLQEFPEVHGSGDAQLESRRVFQLAVIDQLEAEQGSPDGEALLRRAAESYRRVVELSPGAAAALYNLGRVYQQLGDQELAAKAYQAAAAQPGSNQDFYLRQWADFLEAAGRSAEAEAAYAQVVLLEPRLEEPHRILSQRYLQNQDSAKLLSYLWRLVEAQQSARAEDLALTALERGWPEWTRPELLTVVAASLSQHVRAPSDLFESQTGKRLAGLTENPTVGAGVKQLLNFYAKPGNAPSESLKWWNREELEWAEARGVPRRDAIRAVLRGIGDGYRQRGDAKTAAACYQAAIDATPSPDPLALRELAGIYVEQNQLQALNDLATRYANPGGALFAGKNEAYRTGQLETVLQYHRTLGQIYGTLALNNKVSWGDSGAPTTALFQLERAYQVGQRLDGAHPETYGPKSSHVDPDLTVLLAKAYEAKGDAAAGIEVRLDAAGRFTSKGDIRAKDKVLRDIPSDALTTEQVERYRMYQGVKEVAPRSPAATGVMKSDPATAVLKTDPATAAMKTDAVTALTKNDPAIAILKADPATAVVKTDPATAILEAYPATAGTKADAATAIMKADPKAAIMKADPKTAVLEADPKTPVMKADPKTAVTRTDAPTLFKMSASDRAGTAPRAVATTKPIEVPADVVGLDTGIDVKKGQRLEISASGQWSIGGPPAIGPGGHSRNRSESTLLPAAVPGALIAKVGAIAFAVGEAWAGPAPDSGRLFLSINDTPGSFEDNQGRVTAKIKLE